jgi:hypothetical protein
VDVRKLVALRMSLQALKVRGDVLPASQGPADTLEFVALRIEKSSVVEEGYTPCLSSFV